ncbi:MAG TPA: hypothetical protein VK348_14805 [Planctomycetota bacterium]|nr:hypothetical protein [Planctomycetota bacterium]
MQRNRPITWGRGYRSWGYMSPPRPRARPVHERKNRHGENAGYAAQSGRKRAQMTAVSDPHITIIQAKHKYRHRHMTATSLLRAAAVVTPLTAAAALVLTGILHLPTTLVTATQAWQGEFGNPSTMEVTLADVPAGFDVANGLYNGWCIEDNHRPDAPPASQVLLFDSTAPESSLPPSFQGRNWDKVNYLLNHRGGNSVADVQVAMWILVDFYGGSFGGPSAAALQLVADADAHGAGYVPGPSEVVAVLLFTDGIGPDGYQDSLIEVQNSQPSCLLHSAIGSNFNGTPISQGKYIWFNSIVKVKGLPAAGGTFGYRNAHIDFTAGGVAYSLPVPDAQITVAPGAPGAQTNFAGGQFATTVPASYTGNIFLSGLAFQVPANLQGGISPVTWSGEFVTFDSGVSFEWKWAAAVYTNFSTDYNQIGAKPIDGASVLNPYMNSDHAGTPENFAYQGNVVGGARGGAGSNFTGSYSGTAKTVCE